MHSLFPVWQIKARTYSGFPTITYMPSLFPVWQIKARTYCGFTNEILKK